MKTISFKSVDMFKKCITSCNQFNTHSSIYSCCNSNLIKFMAKFVRRRCLQWKCSNQMIWYVSQNEWPLIMEIRGWFELLSTFHWNYVTEREGAHHHHTVHKCNCILYDSELLCELYIFQQFDYHFTDACGHFIVIGGWHLFALLIICVHAECRWHTSKSAHTHTHWKRNVSGRNKLNYMCEMYTAIQAM